MIKNKGSFISLLAALVFSGIIIGLIIKMGGIIVAIGILLFSAIVISAIVLATK